MSTKRSNPIQPRLPAKLWLIGAAPLVLGLGVVTHACSAPEREATHRFIAHARASGAPLHPLDAADPAEAAATIAELSHSTDFTVLYYESRNNPYFMRACVFGRLSMRDGGRWLRVALEVIEGEWRVRDVSFGRRCGKDLRLH